ncbi:MAG: O-antigen ligase family protein [Bacteroidales bacterium]|nr:O-antigen ligase family protein [Bacteroidales bacterium]
MIFKQSIANSIKGIVGKPLVLILSLAFILVNTYLIAIDHSNLTLVPFALVALIVFILYTKTVYYLLIFLTPLSVPLSEYIGGLSFDLWIPTEPLILAFLLLIIFKSIHEQSFNKALTQHPIFWAIVFYLGWLIIASVASKMPVVSIKYTLVRIWFIGVFFYIAYRLFLTNSQNFKYYFGLFIAGLVIVIFISLYHQVGRGLFDKQSAHGSCNPYFTDHTSYGAALAFVIPVVIGLIFIFRNRLVKIGLTTITLFLLMALILSYSRAAWLSLVFGLGIWGIWFLRIRIRTILIAAISITMLAVAFQNDISRWLNNNETASSGNLQEHLKSVTNIKTDDSNVERLNRWISAIRMFRERPLFGYGPGTYMFLYAPYQPSHLKTIASSNRGEKGNAHSEYLGLMAEAGFLGAIGYILILGIVFYRGFRLIKNNPSIKEKPIILGALIGLSTYVFHGALNNFLDMDKIAALFWGLIALIVAMDVKYGSYRKSKPSIDTSSKI